MSDLRRRSRSGERRSVKSSVLPRGMVSRAFLIQKISMRGRVEKPRKVQPIASLKKRRVRPPMKSRAKMTKFKVMTAGELRALLSRA